MGGGWVEEKTGRTLQKLGLKNKERRDVSKDRAVDYGKKRGNVNWMEVGGGWVKGKTGRTCFD